MKGRLITDNMHNFCNLINAANILESPSAAGATDAQFASRAGLGRVSQARLCLLSLPSSTHSGNAAQIHTQTPLCHLSTLEHPIQKCSSTDRECCEWAEGNGNRSSSQPYMPEGKGFLCFHSAQPCGEDKGRCRTCSQGKFYLWKNHKTSEGWELLQQSHTSLPEVTAEQRSFALAGDLWLCPKRVSLGTPRLTLLLW